MDNNEKADIFKAIEKIHEYIIKHPYFEFKAEVFMLIDIVEERLKGSKFNQEISWDQRLKQEREKEEQAQKEQYQKVYRDRRERVLLRLSKGQCEICGEARLDCLLVHHKYLNGKQHRKEMGQDIYSWLEKNNYPASVVCELQVVCRNCHWLKGTHKKTSSF